MEDILWIKHIVVTPPFLTNFRVDMVGFVNPHKVIARRSAFSTFPRAQHEGESKGGTESGGLKHQFSQVEGDLNLQEMFKLVPIPKNNTKQEGSCGVT
jgi:hypothetical protein